MDENLCPLLCLKVKINCCLSDDFNFYPLYTMDARRSESYINFLNKPPEYNWVLTKYQPLCSVLHDHHIIFILALCVREYYLHFTDEITKIQRDWLICSLWNSYVTKQRLKSKQYKGCALSHFSLLPFSKEFINNKAT